MDSKFIDEAAKRVCFMNDNGSKDKAHTIAYFLCEFFTSCDKHFNPKKFMRACFHDKE